MFQSSGEQNLARKPQIMATLEKVQQAKATRKHRIEIDRERKILRIFEAGKIKNLSDPDPTKEGLKRDILKGRPTGPNCLFRSARTSWNTFVRSSVRPRQKSESPLKPY